MSFIHDVTLDYVEQALRVSLMDGVDGADVARAGLVQQGPLQGPVAPDKARISVTLFENDPDRFFKGSTSAMTGPWEDEVLINETGGVVTWARRFCVKARCLLAQTQEDLNDTRSISSTVRSRIELALREASFADLVSEDGERISRGAANIRGEMVQAGGPNSYDYHIKIRFDVLSTTLGVNP
jgi:hypothetical protein